MEGLASRETANGRILQNCRRNTHPPVPRSGRPWKLPLLETAIAFRARWRSSSPAARTPRLPRRRSGRNGRCRRRGNRSPLSPDLLADAHQGLCEPGGSSTRACGSRGKRSRVRVPRKRCIVHDLVGPHRPGERVRSDSDRCRVDSASPDKMLKVWERDTGRVLATLAGHTGTVRSSAVAPMAGAWSRHRIGRQDAQGLGLPERMRLTMLQLRNPKHLGR